jgi:glutaredoxin
VDEEMYPSNNNPLPVLNTIEANTSIKDYIRKADQKYILDGGIRAIDLQDVVVTGKNMRKKSSLNFLDVQVADSEDLNKSSFSYFSEYIKANYQLIDFNNDIPMFRNAPVLFIEDKFTVGYEEISDILLLAQIEKVEFVRDPNVGNIFGYGFGDIPESEPQAAFVITTKNGRNAPPKKKFNKARISPLGFQKPAEFYSPKYESVTSKGDSKPDLRTTIYWKPNLKLDKKGNASFSFYSADTPSTYSIVIEGISDDGKIIYGRDRIVIK